MTGARRAAAVTAVIAMLTVSAVAWMPTYEGLAGLIAAAGGIVIGSAIAMLGAQRAWNALVITALAIVAYLLFATSLARLDGAIAGVLPSLESVSASVRGVVTSWMTLLTSEVPARPANGALLPVVIVSLACSLFAVSIALRWRHVGFAVIPALAAFATALGMGTHSPAAPLVLGAVFATLALAWLAWDRRIGRADALASGDDRGNAAPRRGLVPAALMLAAAIGLGTAGSVAANGGTARSVARDHVTVPFDPRDYPSPLQSYRKYVIAKKDVLFTVDDLPAGARVRLATLDGYDGLVYGVASAQDAGSVGFRHLGRPNASGATSATVTIGSLTGVWVPAVGQVAAVTFAGPHADALTAGAYVDSALGDVVTTAQVTEGDTYALAFTAPTVPTEEVLASAKFDTLALPPAQPIPQAVVDAAIAATANAASDSERVQALVTFLQTNGAFSDGTEGEAKSRSGHGAERIATLLGSTEFVGDDEQYAVAMALMARNLGIPARVTMGFYPDSGEAGPFSATGDNLHAWVEVAYAGLGWVAYDPTPPESKVPEEQQPPQEPNPEPQVPQPPPPVVGPADLPQDEPLTQDALQDQHRSLFGGSLAVVGYAAGGLGALVIISAPFALIILSKRRLRKRRQSASRPSDRFKGGWDELVDRGTDAGVQLDLHATRVETARVLDDNLGTASAVTLALRADSGVFGPAESDDATCAAYWADLEAYVSQSLRGTGIWSRARRSLRLGSLAQRRRQKEHG